MRTPSSHKGLSARPIAMFLVASSDWCSETQTAGTSACINTDRGAEHGKEI